MTAPTYYSVDAEAKIIGSAIAVEYQRDTIFGQISAAAFYDQRNTRVFEWLLDAYMAGTLPADQRDVFTELMRAEVLDRTEVSAYFYDNPTVTPIIEKVLSLATARRLQAASQRTLDTLSVNPEQSGALTLDLKRAIDEIDPSAAHGERLWSWNELAEDDFPQDWIIPDVLDRDWVVMVTGPNGGGKSTLCLHLAISAAIGLHPWTATEVEPMKVLYIDAENSPGVVARKKRIAQKMIDLGGDVNVENIRFRFGTVNLAEPADRLRLEHHMQRFEPDLVVLGPIYKMFYAPKEESWRSEARAIQTWVDTVRRRYGFATLIEGHPPKGQGDGAPKGDSSWASWPYFGFCITLDDNTRTRAEIDPWRYPREPVVMPKEIQWGTPDSHEPTRRLMWSPIGRLISSEEW